jgi:hypothetical protein
VVGGLAVTPGAALAAQPTVDISSFNPNNVLSGGTVTINYTVTNNNQNGIGGGDNDQAKKVRIDFSGAQCAANDCGQNVTIQPGASQPFVSHVKMPQVGAGQTQQVTVSITATINGERSNPDTAQITVQGPDKPQSVRAITGKVKDTGGKGVAAARVGAQDSAGKTFQTVTNASGAFSILSNDANPIAPGNIQVGAGKDGFGDGAVVSVQGEAGKTVNVTLTLKPLQASASASASATPTASSASIDPGSVLDTDAPTGPAVNLPSDDSATKNASQDSGSGSMLFVILGGLLVAAGVGAIVLVLMRRRNAGKGGAGGPGGGPDDPTAMGGGPGVVPASQGRFNDATRVGGAPVGGMGNPAAATMVAPRSGAPSMSEAPTMLHRPVPAADDEFPDPYGAPLPQQGGYAGAAAGGWDDQGANQYGAQGGQYTQAGDDYASAGQYGGGQYNAPAGQERFDEHTSLYRPESEQDGYGDYAQGNGQYGGAQQYGGGQNGGGQNGGGGQYGGGEYGGGGQYGRGAYGGQQDDGYGAGAYGGGGYAQEPAEQGGYGSWGAPAGGIDSGNGYGPQGGGGQGGGAQGGQYGGGAYGGGGAGTGNGGAGNGGGTYGGGGGQYGGGYDDRGGYDQGYDQQPGGGYGGAGNEYGRGNARPPQQPGGGYDQYDEDNNGYGGRRGYEDDQQQPTRRGGGGGGGRRPGGY